MEFLEKIGKKAADAYKATAEKTSQMSKEIKCKLKIENLKGRVNENYEAIGKKVYEVYREEVVDIRRIIKLECEKVDELLEEIEETKIGNIDGDISEVTTIKSTDTNPEEAK